MLEFLLFKNILEPVRPRFALATEMFGAAEPPEGAALPTAAPLCFQGLKSPFSLGLTRVGPRMFTNPRCLYTWGI